MTADPASQGDSRPLVRTSHGELTLEQLGDLLPGTGELMASVGRCFGSCWHAAAGGNWPLADYFLRRTRSLLRRVALVRPRYAAALAEYDVVLGALAERLAERRFAAFDEAYGGAVETANRYHVEFAKPYVRWRRPAAPPADLDLGPGD